MISYRGENQVPEREGGNVDWNMDGDEDKVEKRTRMETRTEMWAGTTTGMNTRAEMMMDGREPGNLRSDRRGFGGRRERGGDAKG